MNNIIKEHGHEGEIHGCIEVLSYYNKYKQYYVRIDLGNRYRVAKLSYEDITSNKIPEKLPGKLLENPYWHLDDGSTILFDINGKEIFIDTEDFDRVKNITWRAHEPPKNRTSKDTWYAFGGKWDKQNKKWIHYALHRYIMNVLDDKSIQIDHIDLDGLNNRKSNLRYATQTENARHKTLYRNNEIGFTGVRFIDGIYEARITVNNKLISLGRTKDIEEAKRLRIEAEKKFFGEFSTARSEENNQQKKGDM